jgi:hypothetical protein
MALCSRCGEAMAPNERVAIARADDTCVRMEVWHCHRCGADYPRIERSFAGMRQRTR